MSREDAYAYRAARQDGAEEVGRVEAASHEAASAILAQRGLFPLEIRLEEEGGARRSRVPVGDLALGLRLLATLLDSGLPISRAMAVLEDLVPGSWQAGLPSIQRAVREGKSLSTALQNAPVDIPPVVIGIIRAGEAGSGATRAIRRAAELTESTAALRRALRNALAYPVLLAGAGAASVALLVGVVIPRFAVILADLGQSLPSTTRLVLATSEVARAGTVPGLVALAVVVIGWRMWTSRESGRMQWHGLLLSLPVIGSARQSAASARASAALAALLESGVPMASALPHASHATGDAALNARMLAARESIIAGQGVAGALEAEQATTPTTVRLIRTGEDTGRLAEMLEHAAHLERERTDQLVRSAVRLLEPALILVFAGIVALIAAALLQAVYSVRPVP